MKKRVGFTLIELLVVIAIIAVLAAILFPVFTLAKREAWQSSCSANEKQLSAALLMYAQDNTDVLPPVATTGWLTNTWQNTVQPYVRTENVFWCPASIKKSTENQFNWVDYGINVYFWNGFQLASIKRPTDDRYC